MNINYRMLKVQVRKEYLDNETGQKQHLITNNWRDTVQSPVQDLHCFSSLRIWGSVFLNHGHCSGLNRLGFRSYIGICFCCESYEVVF